MPHFFDLLLRTMARTTDQQPLPQIQFFKAGNQILRRAYGCRMADAVPTHMLLKLRGHADITTAATIAAEHLVFQMPRLAARICSAVRHAIDASRRQIRLVAKIGYLDDTELRSFCGETLEYLHGVSAINTIPARILRHDDDGVERPSFGKDYVEAGVSGLILQECAIEGRSVFAVSRPEHRPQEDNHIPRFRQLFKKVVREYCQADVPGGFFVSGGIDSSMITSIALAAESAYQTPLSIRLLPNLRRELPHRKRRSHLGQAGSLVLVGATLPLALVRGFSQSHHLRNRSATSAILVEIVLNARS